MTESQAKSFTTKMQAVIQKIRSNLIEGMCGREGLTPANETILQSLHPLIFSRNNEIDLLKTTQLILAKEHIEPIDLYNLILLCNKSLAVRIQADMAGLPIPEINPLPFWLNGWEEE